MWRHAEALRDHRGRGRHQQQVVHDQVEALAAEPVEGVEHDLRGAVEPALVHRHGGEASQVRRLVREQRRVATHRVVRGVDP